MRIFIILAILAGVAAAPAQAGEIDDNIKACSGTGANPDRRVGACTWLLDSGKLNQSSIATVYYLRANAYAAKSVYDHAIRDYSQAIELKPDYAFAYGNRGTAYSDKGAYDRAIRDFDRAIALNPNNALSYSNRANAYVGKGAYDRAIRDYDRAIEVNPKYTPAYYGRGNAYQYKRDYDQALRDYDRTIDLSPAHPMAYNKKAWLLATATDASFRDGEEAERMARRALDLDPDSANFRDTLAAALAESGQFEAAAVLLELTIGWLRMAGREASAVHIKSRLELYRAEKPYRDYTGKPYPTE